MQRKSDSLIFIDGGDPQETAQAKHLMGYIDGQTTNPTAVFKNPDIRKRLERGEKFTQEELLLEYKKIIQEIAKSTDGPISIEVYADFETSAQDMVSQGRDMANWTANAYIKLPVTYEGLKAAQVLRHETKLNMTLCFSQEQAAAVYNATLGATYPLYISPFVGRLDDVQENGMDLVTNILSMYEAGDHHVQVLVASVRNLNHLLYSLQLKTSAITLPFKVFKEWADKGFPIPTLGFVYDRSDLTEIPYRQINLDQDWNTYNIKHELTDIGLQKFVEDWRKLLK